MNDRAEQLEVQQRRFSKRIRPDTGSYRPYRHLPKWARELGFGDIVELNSALRAQANETWLEGR